MEFFFCQNLIYTTSLKGNGSVLPESPVSKKLVEKPPGQVGAPGQARGVKSTVSVLNPPRRRTAGTVPPPTRSVGQMIANPIVNLCCQIALGV